MQKLNLIILISLIMALPGYIFANDHSSYDMNHSPSQNHNHENISDSKDNKDYSGKVINNIRVIKVIVKDYKFYPSTITVKKGEKVNLNIMNLDKGKLHGIEIKSLKINRELPFNEEINIEFKAAETGKFHFHCSIPCGAGHYKMHGTLIVSK